MLVFSTEYTVVVHVLSVLRILLLIKSSWTFSRSALAFTMYWFQYVHDVSNCSVTSIIMQSWGNVGESCSAWRMWLPRKIGVTHIHPKTYLVLLVEQVEKEGQGQLANLCC